MQNNAQLAQHLYSLHSNEMWCYEPELVVMQQTLEVDWWEDFMPMQVGGVIHVEEEIKVRPQRPLALGQIDSDLLLAERVRSSGKPNVYGLRVPVPSNWNFSLLDSLATSVSDREVVSFLKYGWPLNRELPVPLTITCENHKGALLHASAVDDYIVKELDHGTLVGPLCTLPSMDRMAVSPMSTRPKTNSIKRRIISDLSWPQGPLSMMAFLSMNIWDKYSKLGILQWMIFVGEQFTCPVMDNTKFKDIGWI